jgi:hypothetical protein
MALCTGNAEEGVDSGQRRRSIVRRSTRTWHNRLNLELILASHPAAGAPFHQSGQRRCHSRDHRLVLTTAAAAATSFLHRGTDIKMWSFCIGHGDSCWEGKTLDAMRKRKMMRRRRKLMNRLGFCPHQTCFIYKYTLMGF